MRKKLDCNIKIAAVVQADNVADYMQQLLQFNEIPEVDLIGISILSVPKSFGLPIVESRIELMKKMINLADQGIVWKDMHLLGLGDSYEDVVFAKNNCPWIKSNDTSCCFQSGLFGVRLTDNLKVPGGKVEEKVVFKQEILTDIQRNDIQFNINQVKKVFS